MNLSKLIDRSYFVEQTKNSTYIYVYTGNLANFNNSQAPFHAEVVLNISRDYYTNLNGGIENGNTTTEPKGIRRAGTDKTRD